MKSKRRTLTMMLFTVVLTVLMSAPAFAASGFTDVPPESPWYDGVTYLAENDITAGTGNNCYSPDLPITVRQWSVMVCRALEKDEAFSDETAPFGALSVNLGFSQGWIAMEGAVAPDTKMCRGAVLLSALRVMGYEIYDYSLYPNGEHLSGWENALRIGKEAGLCGEEAAAWDIMTRGEIASLLHILLTQELNITEPPMLNALPIENKSEVALNEYLLQLCRVPDDVLQAFSDAGWKYIIDFDHMAAYSKEKDENYIGLTYYGSKRIVVSDPAATVHEFGHFLDKALGLPAKHQELFNTEAQATESVLRDYARTNHKEYFAEYFEYWVTWHNDSEKMEQLQTATPLTYSYFVTLSKNNWSVISSK